MREIKFRAWDKKYGWVLPGTHVNESDRPTLQLNGVGSRDGLNIMQYTGLKDKNGVEIYQGDYLKVKADIEGYGHTSYGGIVEVISETCGHSFKAVKPTLKEIEEFKAFHEDGGLAFWDSSSMWHVDDPKNIEVIGNIYENEDLL